MARVRDAIGMGTAPQAAQALVNSQGSVTGTGTGSQANGVLLSFACNNLITASSLDTFVLPTSAQGSMVGDVIYATTDTATTGVVYPGGAETIVNSASAKSIAQSKTGVFIRNSSTNWGFLVTA
jgi:hypothetical protein